MRKRADGRSPYRVKPKACLKLKRKKRTIKSRKKEKKKTREENVLNSSLNRVGETLLVRLSSSVEVCFSLKRSFSHPGFRAKGQYLFFGNSEMSSERGVLLSSGTTCGQSGRMALETTGEPQRPPHGHLPLVKGRREPCTLRETMQLRSLPSRQWRGRAGPIAAAPSRSGRRGTGRHGAAKEGPSFQRAVSSGGSRVPAPLCEGHQVGKRPLGRTTTVQRPP